MLNKYQYPMEEEGVKEYEDRLKGMLSEYFKINVNVTFFEEEHEHCPLGFDLYFTDDCKTLKLNVYSCKEEEPNMFWETVREELESEIGRCFRNAR